MHEIQVLRTDRAPLSGGTSRKAYGLVEIILGLAIMGGVVLGASRYVQQGSDLQTARGMAQRATEINAAADVYLRTQISSVRDALPNVGDVTVVPMTGGPNAQGLRSMQAIGAIGQRFTGLGPYGQGAQLVIQRNPDVGPAGIFDYEAYVVYPGGRAVPDRILAQATALADGRTGAVLTRDPSGAGSARGFKGGWAIPSAVLDGIAPTSGQQGRLVSYVSMQKGLGAELQGKWLSRILTGDESDNRMEANINVGNHALNNVGWLGGQNLVSNPDSTLPRAGVDGQVSVDGNLVLDPSRQVGGQATRVEAPKLASNLTDNVRGPDGKPMNPGLTVAGNALINDLSANRINADAVVYDGTGVRGFPDGVKLTDLIPNHVIKSSWVARNGDFVPKPATCGGTSNTQGLARIFIIPDGQQNVALPVVNTVSNVAMNVATVVGAVSSDGNNNISVTYVEVPYPTRIDTVTDVRPATMRMRAFATEGAFGGVNGWFVYVVSVATDNTGSLRIVDDGGYNHAVVQVSCYFS